MAFWGVEVKPEKPFTYSCENARGRLKITQATLGFGTSKRKSVVQCNVGSESPVLLCVLLPYKNESCHLDLKFEEAADVVFSVIGSRSVYLTGYCVLQSQRSGSHSDTESYGVDIVNTQSGGSSYCSDDDKYDDSFINDDDEGLKVSAQSPVLDNKGLEEISLESEKRKDTKVRGKRSIRKKHPSLADDVNPRESADEERNLLSVAKGTSISDASISDTDEAITKVLQEIKNSIPHDGIYGGESMQKVDPLDTNGKLDRETELSLNDRGDMVKNTQYELPKKNNFNIEVVLTGNINNGINQEETINNQNTSKSNEIDQMRSPDIAKLKRKRKDRSKKKGKTSADAIGKDHDDHREGEVHEVEASINLESKLASESSPKSKKRKELLFDEIMTNGIDSKGVDTFNNDKLDQEQLATDIMDKDMNRKYQELQSSEEICVEKTTRKSLNIYKDDEFEQASMEINSSKIDHVPADGEFQDELNNNINKKAELQAGDGKPEKSSKKKTKRTKRKKDLKVDLSDMATNQETLHNKDEDQTHHTVPNRKSTLSNGLIIEDLVSRPPDGKVAEPGKKIKLYYTGMLKDSGHVFDSNVGKEPCRFVLGDEEFIDGWNIGIEGMRVGDKRRLTIPPSLGFGNIGDGEKVPPNAWIVYDIELLGVRR